MLRNNMQTENLRVTPVLRLANGSEVTLQAVTVAPGTVAKLNLRQALLQSIPGILNLTDPYGSAVLQYTAPSNGTLYASAMIYDDGHPVIFHLDGAFQDSDYGRGSREGIWWLPKATTHGYFVATNFSNAERDGMLLLYNASGTPWKEAITLEPKQTIRFPLRDLVSASGLSGDYGGISLQLQQGAGDISSALLLYDESAGFSANMKMFDWDPLTTLQARDFAKSGKWTTRASMLALENPDPALQLPSNTVLHPEIFIRNTANRPVKAQVMLHWRRDPKNGRAALPEITLAPNETRIIDVKQLQDSGAIPADAYWAQVTIVTNTAPRETMAVASSFDDTLRYGAQTPFSDQLSAHLEGGAWRVDANHDSIIAAGNGTGHPVIANLSFFYADGTKKYQIVQTIAPYDQMWVDVGELIRNGIPDKDGNVLPADLTTSAYSLRDVSAKPSPSLCEGKLITDKTYGHATYGCMVCCGYYGFALTPAEVWAELNGFENFDVEGVAHCGGGMQLLDDYATSWTSGDTSIMTVQPRTANGVGIGSTTLHVELSNIEEGPIRDGQTCPFSNYPVQGPGNVASVAVTKLDLTSDTVTVQLSSNQSITGSLVVTWNGPSGNSDIADETVGPGTYTFNPSLSSLTTGQYSGVKATWTIDGQLESGSKTYNFNVLGKWRHSQYNTPNEASCAGTPASAYQVNVTTCAYQTNNLKSDFISQSWENGSGISVTSYYGYNVEQNAQYCINHNYLPSDATGKSFAFEPKLVPYCGSAYSISNNTVAWNFSSTSTLNCGDQVLLVGYGGSPGTVKTVTDMCAPDSKNPSGCSNTQLDNYTTGSACPPGAFNDLGSFITIRLGR